MFKKPFKSSSFQIIDNTFKFIIIALIVLITNSTMIISKINSFNFNINVNILIIVLLAIITITLLIINVIKWKITYVSYYNKKITVYKNIFIKNMYEFTVNNISSIVIEQSIFERLLKVIRIKIYSNVSNNYLNDLEIVVNNNDGNNLIEKILQDLNYISNYNKHIENNNVHKNRVSFKRIIFHSFSTIPFNQIFIIVNAISIIILSLKNVNYLRYAWKNTLKTIVTIFGILLPVFYDLLKSLSNLYGFCIIKENNILNIQSGLIVKKKYIVPISKIRGVILKETVISRVFNYVTLNILCSGITDNKNELRITLPMIKKENINNFMNEILEYNNYNLGLKCNIQNNKSIYLYICILTAIAFIETIVFIIYKQNYWNILVVFSFNILLGIFLFFFKKYRYNDEYIEAISGIFIKKIVNIKYVDIKYFKIRKIGKLKKLEVYIISGIKNRRHSLGYVKDKDLKDIVFRILDKRYI